MTRNKRFKTKLLEDLSKQNNAFLLCFTESHLRKNILDAEIHIERFELIRADRLEGRKKGGVAAYVRNDVIQYTKILKQESNGEVEHLLLYISKWNLVLSIIYRPPYCSTDNFTRIIGSLKAEINRLGNPEPNIVIMGDFNLPIIQWDTNEVYGGSASDRQQSNTFLSFIDEFILKQLIDTPTRERSILDLLLTNNEDIFSAINIEDTVMSDHRLVIMDTTFDTTKERVRLLEPDSFASLNFRHKNTDWNAINEDISNINWTDLLENKSSEDIYELILTKLLDISKTHTPTRQNFATRDIPRDRKILMRKRTRLKKTKILETNQYRIERIQNQIREIDNNLSLSCDNELKVAETRAVSKISANPKYFYTYVRSKAVTRSSIGPLLYRGELVNNPKLIVRALNEQYNSVFSKPMTEYRVTQENSVTCQLEDICFNQTDIETALSEVKMDSAAGPDQVPAILLKKCTKTISTPLYILWKSSLNQGKIPAALKHGMITPIYKGGDKTQPKQYRPVSLTSHVIKLFERIIVKKLRDYMEENELYNPGQHGFRSGRSCLSQLVQHYAEILNALENKRSVDVIYLDFSKAFDKVDHTMLLRKLSSQFGITAKLLGWIQDFFTNRTQAVVVDGVKSEKSTVVSGVAQGSVIGPMLFLMYVTDIDHQIEYCRATSFADDTRLLGIVKNNEDCVQIQKDLTKVYAWAQNNNMEFNSSKCELMKYIYPNQEQINFIYKDPTGETIQRSNEVRDLGIIMNDNASFDTQIHAMVKKAKQNCGWILRSFRTRDAHAMLTLFRAMVLPVMEYCCQLWNPTSIGQIRELEGIQRTFTARIQNTDNMDYWRRLKHLNLYSLERRRERYLIIYVWKIINGQVPNIAHPNNIKMNSSDRRGPLCHIPPIIRTRTHIQTLKEGSFTVQGPRLYNCIPKELRQSTCSLVTFKKRLDEFLHTIPDQPALPHYYQPSQSNSLLHQIQHRH